MKKTIKEIVEREYTPLDVIFTGILTVIGLKYLNFPLWVGIFYFITTPIFSYFMMKYVWPGKEEYDKWNEK